MSKAIYSLLLISLVGITLSTLCQDGNTCPGTTTCCLTPSGVGCCPYDNATCCGDGLHCCPNSYNCVNNGCRRTGDEFTAFLATNPINQDYISLTPSSPAKGVTPAVNVELAFPSISDIIKCVEDIKPLVKDVLEAVNDIKAGNTQAALELLPRLAAEGTALVLDCGKIVKTEAPKSSVYLDVSFPSINDIIKCVSDIQPLVANVIVVVNDIKKGDTSAALALIPQLIAEGAALVNDCAKVVKDLK